MIWTNQFVHLDRQVQEQEGKVEKNFQKKEFRTNELKG